MEVDISTLCHHLVCRVVQSLHTNHMQMSINIQMSAYGHYFNNAHLHMVGMQTLYNSTY